ncbi:DUF6283 family protein [Pseudomonas arcuscaelestis]|uniref:DUF6283 family protein n=1 Tax=Pseudomonas arcuscaelestis TaxID=2710591 RepID=UPI001F2CE638|nr:DUF6283 family protein [Pseudomonas arcuscaelestis]
MKTPTVTEVRPADWNHNVVTVTGGTGAHCKRPCKRCPWRKDAVGEFPADAFRHSASTAYDMAQSTFGCHSRGIERPAVCAGFLMVGAAHNLRVRLKQMKGEWLDATDGGHELFESYRAMAEANGVPADDPALIPCRSKRD